MPNFTEMFIVMNHNDNSQPQKKTQRVKMNIHKLQNLEYALRHLEKEGVSRFCTNKLYFIL